MLTYSPQGALLLTQFQLVVSGLSLGALLWIRFGGKVRFPTDLLVAGFALLFAAFALEAEHYRSAIVSDGVTSSYRGLLVAADVTRLCSSLCLGAGCLMWSGHHSRVKAFVFVGVATALAAFVRLPYDWAVSLTSIDPLNTLRLADVAVLALAAVLTGSPISRVLALSLLSLGRASALASAVWPAWTEWSWSAGYVLVLAGLMLFALMLESTSERRLMQYVLRLNLTFVVLALSLTIALAEISRRQFTEFAALQLRDLAEFARGRLVYEDSRGVPLEQTLASPPLTEGIVREFGRYPDLRRVWLELRGQSMALAISENGDIDQRFWSGDPPAHPSVAPADFSEAVLLSVPVVVAGSQVGHVILSHSVLRLNASIGRQMQIAFGVFTLFVVVGSLVTGILVAVADRTIRVQEQQLAEARSRLRLSERLASIGAVADGLAHEVNNPAGVLVARSDYLLSVIADRPDSAEIKEDLETIRRQAQRIAKTVQDLLTSTRAGRRPHGPVDIVGVVDSALTLVRPIVHRGTVTFESRSGRDRLWVLGDRDRLEQALVDLLLNAAQAIPGHGRVTVEVSARPGGSWTQVVVTDTGIGIKPEHMDRIFDRFFTTKEPGTGSGLGLSIVQAIVIEHGGSIDAVSTAGKGTSFRMNLRSYRPGIERAETPVARTQPMRVEAVPSLAATVEVEDSIDG